MLDIIDRGRGGQSFRPDGGSSADEVFPNYLQTRSFCDATISEGLSTTIRASQLALVPRRPVHISGRPVYPAARFAPIRTILNDI